MKRILVFSLILISVSSMVISGCAEPAPEGQQVTFPDENLEEGIREALGKSSDEQITTTELATLTELKAEEIGEKGIINLSGLEYCTNLVHLDLGLNQIGDISAIANLTNLDFLCLAHNHHITDISPVANLTNLTHFWITHNKVSDISPLANLNNLTDLRLWDNQISDISPLAGLTNLTYLGIRSNQISDISPLANLTNLTYLELANNQISDISHVTDLTKLTKLKLAYNQISDISPLVENTGLGTGDIVWLEENNLDLEEGSDDMENIKILVGRGVEVNY